MTARFMVGLLIALATWLCLPLRPVLHPAGTARVMGTKGFSFKMRRRSQPSHSLVFTEVAALLRVGVPPGAAWKRVTGVAVSELGIPNEAALARLVGNQAAASMVAAATLALNLGAPLARVLLQTRDSLLADEEAKAERTAAFAGPQTTSRVLLALPLVGVGLGILLGGNPVKTMLSGGIGTWSVILGVFLLGLGRWWIARLIASAQQIGEA